MTEATSSEVRTFHLLRGSQREESAPLRWLVPGWIPQSSVTILIGQEGSGKSQWLSWLVGLITTGKACKDMNVPKRVPQGVLLVTTEDPWAEVVRPRLEVVGADLDLVYNPTGDDAGVEAPMLDAAYMTWLREQLTPDTDPIPDDYDPEYDFAPNIEHEIGLMIVDAWVDTFPSSYNLMKPREAREAMRPFSEFARHTGIPVVLLVHPNRQQTGSLRDSYGLTGELRKLARSTIWVEPAESGLNEFVIGPEKGNLTAPVNALRFAKKSRQVFEATAEAPGTVAYCEPMGPEGKTIQQFVESKNAQLPGVLRGKAPNATEQWIVKTMLAHPNGGIEVPTADVQKACGDDPGCPAVWGSVQNSAGNVVLKHKAGFGSGWVWTLLDKYLPKTDVIVVDVEAGILYYDEAAILAA